MDRKSEHLQPSLFDEEKPLVELCPACRVELVGLRAEVAQTNLADLDRRLGQIDTAIEVAAKRGRTGTALAVIEGQRKVRAALVQERNAAAGTLAALKTERASVVATGHRVESEAAPIQYVAAMFGVLDPEQAIRWLIALMVMCCDPLAIALTAATAAKR